MIVIESDNKKTIEEFLPMWTNKQVWEFEQINEDLRFDLLYTDSTNPKSDRWNSKRSYLDSDIRDRVVKTFDHLADGYELWIVSKGQKKLESRFVSYVMAVMTDIMIDEEICLNFAIKEHCLTVTVDTNADVIDCKEFFEKFYHLATGFNYEINTGIPDDETEAEIYLTRLQEEFDEKMKSKLGDKYLPGNNDPETLSEKESV